MDMDAGTYGCLDIPGELIPGSGGDAVIVFRIDGALDIRPNAPDTSVILTNPGRQS